jgi:transposase-like protein
MPAFNYDLASVVLVEAAFLGDKATSKKFGISTRTLQRWRKRLNEDGRLSSFVAQRKKELDKAWAEEMPIAIKASIDFIRRAAQEAAPNDPDAIHSIAGALKILSEVAMTREVLDARLARQNRQANQTD